MKRAEAIKLFWKNQHQKSYDFVKQFKIGDEVEWDGCYVEIEKGIVVGFGLRENDLDLFGDGGKRIIQVKTEKEIRTVNALNLRKIK